MTSLTTVTVVLGHQPRLRSSVPKCNTLLRQHLNSHQALTRLTPGQEIFAARSLPCVGAGLAQCWRSVTVTVGACKWCGLGSRGPRATAGRADVNEAGPGLEDKQGPAKGPAIDSVYAFRLVTPSEARRVHACVYDWISQAGVGPELGPRCCQLDLGTGIYSITALATAGTNPSYPLVLPRSSSGPKSGAGERLGLSFCRA
jgi:hypothetical protein